MDIIYSPELPERGSNFEHVGKRGRIAKEGLTWLQTVRHCGLSLLASTRSCWILCVISLFSRETGAMSYSSSILWSVAWCLANSRTMKMLVELLGLGSSGPFSRVRFPTKVRSVSCAFWVSDDGEMKLSSFSLPLGGAIGLQLGPSIVSFCSVTMHYSKGWLLPTVRLTMYNVT